MPEALRVIDAGSVSAACSQALWHGITAAMAPGDPPVLSFCRPSAPYVCIGYHRHLQELDLERCAELGLPVVRRQIGGGPVYLDADQLFFALSLPAADAPVGVTRLYEQLLGPAVGALQALGVDAALAGVNDIVAAAREVPGTGGGGIRKVSGTGGGQIRKVSGTGGGQIGEGVVVVGNVMFAFPHERMAAVLSLPDECMRDECLELMRAHVGALPALREEPVKARLTDAYAAALGRAALSCGPVPREGAAIAFWERRLQDRAWTEGPALAPLQGPRQVKIREGVWCRERDAVTHTPGLVSCS